MTTLALTSTFIAPVSDLSDVLVIDQSDESHVHGARVDVRRYAGGRRRVVSRPGVTGSVSVSYRYLSRADYVALVELLGVTVLFRDQRERAVYGVVADLSASEFNARDLLEDVSFTLTEISFSEIV